MDKQFVMMVAITAIALVGGMGFGPFIALLVYYLNAVLRPQNMWQHIPSVRDTAWSFYAAAIAILSTLIYRFGLIGYVTSGPTRGARISYWNLIHWTFLVFALWICLRHSITLYSFVPEDVKRSDEVFNEYWKMFVMFLVSSLVIYRLSQLWVLMAVIALADVYVAYEMNANYLKFGKNIIHTHGYGGLDNNGAGLMLSMGIPLCYFLWEGTQSKFRWVFMAGIPVLVHAVMLTFSRGAMVSVIACSPIIFLFSRHKRWLSLLAILAVCGVVYFSGPELRDRFLSIEQHDLDASANSRKIAWRVATQLANENPFFGVGIRCSQRHVAKYGADQNQAIHSQYLQLAADTGWIGMVLFIALVLSVLWACYRFWWRSRKWPAYPEVIQARAMAGGLTASIVLYCVGALFLSLDNFELPYIQFMIVAQLWGVYKGGGIEASVWVNGSAVPVTTSQQPLHRRRMVGAPIPARRNPPDGNLFPSAPISPDFAPPALPPTPAEPFSPTTPYPTRPS
jgi:probable O-glycosylation ligase (exosortase A-associated)